MAVEVAAGYGPAARVSPSRRFTTTTPTTAQYRLLASQSTTPNEKMSLLMVEVPPHSTSGACIWRGTDGDTLSHRRLLWCECPLISLSSTTPVRPLLLTSQRGLSMPPTELDRVLSSRRRDRLKSQTCFGWGGVGQVGLGVRRAKFG